MDWISRSRLTNFFIAILLTINVISVSIIWIQIDKKTEPRKREQREPREGSDSLLKQALDLSDDQVKQYNLIRRGYLEKTKFYNDNISELKIKLIDELFKERSDSSLVTTITTRMGMLQTEVEKIRYYQIKKFLDVCDPLQKKKFQPIALEIFGRKGLQRENVQKNNKQNDRDSQERTAKNGVKQPPHDEKQSPPSLGEKLRRYDQRLQLTEVQKKKIQTIFEATFERMEQLKKRMKPDHEEFEVQKKIILESEDKNIMSVLDENQKQEFIRMQERKRK